VDLARTNLFFSEYILSTSMDDPISPLLYGLIANAFYDLGKTAFRGSAEEVEEGSPLDQAIAAAARQLTEVELVREDLGGERLKAFLASYEMRQLARQAFAVRAMGTPRRDPDEKQPEEELLGSFVRTFQSWTGVDDRVAEEQGERIFHSFLRVCDLTLERLVARSSLEAHELRSLLRWNRLEAELSNLSRNLELQERQRVDLAKIDEFEAHFRRQVLERDTQISLPSLTRRLLVPVDNLFVTPVIRDHASGQEVSYRHLISADSNFIILGDPGGGKSTLISKLVADLGEGEGGEARTAIVVVLREYAAKKEETGCSLIEFVAGQVSEKYQMGAVAPHEVEYILRNRKVVVFLDGLDELLETSMRRTVAGNVESFCSLFPTVPVIATSRKVGYDEAPLKGEGFQHLELGGLDDERVPQFAEKVFAANGAFEGEREWRVADFAEKSEGLEDLRGNPLLLSLLLERYIKTLNLPADRFAVIESCALLLFERWDSDKGIPVLLPFESKLKPVVGHLAHTIYLEPTLQEGVTDTWLVAQTADFLVGRKYENRAEAAVDARDFVRLCSGRIWVFSEAGLNRLNEPLFEFTHRTFLEYFVAAHLSWISQSATELLDRLEPKIEAQEWDEVCLQAVYMLGQRQSDAPDQILAILLPGTVDSPQAANLVSFCARSLKAVVPDRLTSVDLFARAFLEAVEHLLVSKPGSGTRDSLGILLHAVVNSHPDNQETLARRLPDVVAAVARHEREASGAEVLDVMLHLPMLLMKHSSDEAKIQWEGAAAAIAQAHSVQIYGYGKLLIGMAVNAVVYGLKTLKEFVRQFEIGGLFGARSPRHIAEKTGRPILVPSLAERVLQTLMLDAEATWERDRDWTAVMLDEVADLLPNALPSDSIPGWKVPGERPTFPRWASGQVNTLALASLTPRQRLGAAFLLVGLTKLSSRSLRRSGALDGSKGLRGELLPTRPIGGSDGSEVSWLDVDKAVEDRILAWSSPPRIRG
jgi:hypothetical protein